MNSKLKRLTAGKTCVKSNTQTTISRFFSSAADKGAKLDEPRINSADHSQESRGKVSMVIRHARHTQT